MPAALVIHVSVQIMTSIVLLDLKSVGVERRHVLWIVTVILLLKSY